MTKNSSNTKTWGSDAVFHYLAAVGYLSMNPKFTGVRAGLLAYWALENLIHHGPKPQR
ncbi:MAG: hypothetical protein ACLQO7_07045 [Candidatus Bathyarchaeia archaeon]